MQEKTQATLLKNEESSYVNHIHTEDLANICMIVAHKIQRGMIYNVSDGQPCTLTEYMYAVADFYHLPRPPSITMKQAQAVFDTKLLSFYRESKRIDNTRLIDTLGVRLKYPDFLSGLASCLASPS